MVEQEVVVKGRRLSYQVRFNRRRTTRSVIKICPDGGVLVDCPVSINLLEVRRWVLEQAEWLIHRRSLIANGPGFIAPLSYVENEQHLFLGKQYSLKLFGSNPSVQVQGLSAGSLCIRTARVDASIVKAKVWRWYKQQARNIFQKRLSKLSAEVPWVKGVPELKLRKMRRRWGSCTSHGLITLNTHLIKAPQEFIDYVILHELCHLREHNHSQRFYRLMDQVLPEWRLVKKGLVSRSDFIANE